MPTDRTADRFSALNLFFGIPKAPFQDILSQCLVQETPVRSPGSSLGFHAVSFGFLDQGPIQAFDNKLDGGGVRGAFGYIMPGSTLRFELGGSYVSADGSSQQASTTPQPSIGAVFLGGGSSGNAIGCVAGCVTSGSHSSDYHAWEINGKAAWDMTWGSVIVSPSLAVFGGNSRNREGLSQKFQVFDVNGVLLSTQTYQATTRLGWTDYGARAGLDARFPVLGAWTVDVGGWLGVAQRDVRLNGSDVLVGPFPSLRGASSISVSDDRAVFLANAEAGLSYKFNPNFTIRGFAGVNYDNKVPEISAPTFSGTVIVRGVGTAAGIAYSSETSYYTGGGLLMKF